VRKRVYIALAVLLVVIAGVSAWQGLREREPVYQGKRLSVWLKAYQISGFVGIEAREKANAAVRQAGTNAISTLLRMLRAKDWALKVKLMDLASRQHFIKIEYTPAQDWHLAPLYAFEVLGAEAQSAVPALIEIANQNISPESRYCALDALGYIGPPAKEAVYSLLRWSTNSDYEVRGQAFFALGKIGTEPDRVLPVLINALHDESGTVQTCAILALKDYGPNAKRAVPALVEFLNTHDDATSDRSYATNALKAIDPEAAAKAGVK
jgi:hypothetical protein